jgi:hypothetical protein
MRVSSKPARRTIIAALALGLGAPVAAQAADVNAALPVSAIQTQTVHVTERDNNSTVHVLRGAHLDIDLHSPAGSWDAPGIDRTDVLREDSHWGGYPGDTDSRAAFTALAPGNATITSATDFACLHTNPHCMLAGVPFRVNVVVDAPAARTRTASEETNHHTITVRRGSTVAILLHSTYWTIHAPAGHTLTATGAQVTTPDPKCIPGVGCGTTQRTFRATRVGSTRLHATRTSCGEIMRCTGTTGQFDLTVVVVP